MTELKTIKDLIKKAKIEDELSFAGYTEDYLKQEAIKWVRELQKEDNGMMPAITTFGKSQRFAIISFIKHFFNVTEEDLT